MKSTYNHTAKHALRSNSFPIPISLAFSIKKKNCSPVNAILRPSIVKANYRQKQPHMSRDPARLYNAEMIAMKEKQGITSDQLTNLDRICYEVKPELHLSYQMTEHMADLSYGSFNL